MDPAFPRTVGVVGGGTAGYFAALALKRRFPELKVTLIESSAIPVIGVGEATTTLMPPFLHRQLGLDIVELFRAVRPTFKMGIKFIWGPEEQPFFTYPFGATEHDIPEPLLAQTWDTSSALQIAWPLESSLFEGELRSQSLASLLISEDRGPIVRGPGGALLSLLPSLRFGYHLDNQPFVAYLAGAAREAGIAHLDVRVDSAEVRSDGAGVDALRTADGQVLRFDLYIDASGFRSILLEGALRSPFQSYTTSLFCDRAIVATVPQRGPVECCTTAETMDAGWCWRVPMLGEDHRGYVHASSFLSEDAAVAEMRAQNPEMGEPRTVRFRSGRHRDFWVGNTVGLGNAYAFVEPLESTALHMIIVQIGHLLDGLSAARDREIDTASKEKANLAVGSHWDSLRDFLAVHYKFNGRKGTPFWCAARADTDVSGVRRLLERYVREGPRLEAEGERTADPTFGYSGLITLLLGQRAPGSEHARAAMGPKTWATILARSRGVAARALPHRDALLALLENPSMLTELVDSPRSWCSTEAAVRSA